MDLLTLLDQLSEENIALVYLFHGPERFLIDLVTRRLKGIHAQGPMAELNAVRLSGRTVSGAEISLACRELPMMAGHRFVVVDEGERLKADDWQSLDPYLAQPAPSTCLVVIAERFDLRRSVFSRAAKRGQVFKAEPLGDRGIIPFLRTRARAREVRLSEAAVAALAQAVGPDLAALDDAVERLGLYVGAGQEVQEIHVSEVVTAVRQHSVFELVEAIGNRQPQRALVLMEELISRREEPLKLNALVARHFRQLLGARIHLHLRTDYQKLPGLLGAPQFVVKKLLNQSRGFRGAELERALKRLALADRELKSSRRPGELVISEALLDLCRGSAASR